MNNIKDPAFWLGVVEDRMDPLMLGRVRVRVVGLHTHDKGQLPTEDLPWAYKVQPTTSGALSGIGIAPVGVLEGTWVLVQYVDPDKQMPFVVGSIGGIPQSKVPDLESFQLLNQEQSIVSSTDGTPITTQSGGQVVTDTSPEGMPATTLPGQPASSYKVSDTVIESLKKSEGFRPCPYDDGVGVWTIGYGNTFLADGSKVTQNTPCITQQQGDQLLRLKISTDFEPAVQKATRVPLTQSMYDSLVHLAYNVGGGGVRAFINESGLNSGNYEQAAAYFDSFRIRRGTAVERGLRNRRQYEKTLFLRDGLPKVDGTVAETPQSQQQKVDDLQQLTTLTQEEIETLVYRITPFTGPRGFRDPSNKYPLSTHLNEPDTNRLARHQKINETIVRIKEVAEHKGVEKANGRGAWSQASTPYNAKYPFNNVVQTESGHTLEFDDTPGAERIHLYHKTGTFTEVDHNGTQVNRIVGDGFEIIERNGYVHVVGDLDVKIDGAHTLRVDNTLDVEVHGVTNINIHDSASLNIAGNLQMTVGGSMAVRSGGTMSFDAPRIDLNSGVGDGLSFINAIGGTDQSIPTLPVNIRGEEVAVIYEVTDENDTGGYEAYRKKVLEQGLATAEELDNPPSPVDQQTPPPNKIEPVAVDCNAPSTQTDFSGAEQMSKMFTLSDLTAGNTRKLRSAGAFTAAQVFCNLKALAQNVLDPLKTRYPNLKINSCYRNEVPPGGSSVSQHMTGQAVDVSFPGVTREQLYDRILEVQQLVPYDQLILEYATGPGWIHISFNAKGNRKHQFTMNHHRRVSPDMYTIVRVY